MIVKTRSGVTLLGAGQLYADDIQKSLDRAPVLVAADGGAAQALSSGQTPRAVIGDFDSLPFATRASLPPEILFHVSEQDSTDFEKCMQAVDAPWILALGFTGKRVDHELAVYNGLAKFPDKRCIVVGEDDIVFHAPPRLAIDLPRDSRFSLFPLSNVTGRSTGLKWPIDGLHFAPDGRVGTSNRVSGPVTLEFDGPGMLVILPRAARDAAIEALTEAG